LAQADANTQTKDARDRRTGQQDGAHCLGADDEERELQESGISLTQWGGLCQSCEKVGGEVRTNGQ